MKLWLVRHAQPLVAAGVCYGALDIEPEAAATEDAARALAQALPQGMAVQSSPLSRCERLAQSLCAQRPDLTYKVDENLREMNFGTFEGVAWAAIGQQAMDVWTGDFWGHRFGGVESVQSVMHRVASSWDVWQSGGRPAAWITHAGVIRACMLLARGVREVQHADQWPLQAPAYGAWVEVTAQSPNPPIARRR